MLRPCGPLLKKMLPSSVPVCPCAVSSWPFSSPRLSAAILLPRALREPLALWGRRVATNTGMNAPLRPLAAKAGNPTLDQAEITSPAVWPLTKATIRARSLSSHQCRDTARQTTKMERFGRLQNTRSHMKRGRTKIRKAGMMFFAMMQYFTKAEEKKPTFSCYLWLF